LCMDQQLIVSASLHHSVTQHSMSQQDHVALIAM